MSKQTFKYKSRARERLAGWLPLLFVACAVVAADVAPTAAQGRPEVGKYTLELRSRTFTPSTGMDDQTRASLTSKLREKRRARLFVQFNELPSAEERSALEKDGLTLLTYVGGNAFTARVERQELIQATLDKQVRWVGEIAPEDKLQPELLRGEIGEWARLADGRIELRVTFFPDVEPGEAAAVLGRFARQERGYEASTSESLGGATWIVRLPQENIRALAGADEILYVEQEPPPLEPINDVTRGTIRTEGVQGPPPPAYSGLTGMGVQVGVMDSGLDATHDDFAGRILRNQATAGDHGTHVAGTVLGSGVRSAPQGGAAFQWRGHAPRAEVAAFGFSWAVVSFDDAIDNFGVDLTNHSHTQTPAPDYSSNSRSVDEIIWDRNLYVAAAAGNNGVNPNNGSPLRGYFSLTGSKAKNPLTVGNYNSATAIRDRSSSMGPTFDGRLKPDVVAPGTGIRSTTFGDAYNVKTGTSMASPAVAGVLALMLESYFTKVDPATRPLNSTLKAVLIHSATDLVQLPALGGEPNNVDTGVPVVYHAGPDWATGYGLVDAEAATEIIANPGLYTEEDIGATGEEDFHLFAIPAGTPEIKVTLVWDDFPGSILTANTAPKLVNDLDLVLLAPDGSVFQPFVLPPLTPEPAPFSGTDPIAPGDIVPAAPGADHLNNVEQVLVTNPMAGIWQVRVRGFSVPMPAQAYSLVRGWLAEPRIQVPGGVDLGEECVGASTTAVLDICNTGPGDLIVDPIVSSDPQFSVTTPSAGYPLLVVSGACFPFQVSFAPASTGPQNATLSIPSNDPDNPSTVVAVSGRGAEQDVRVTGSTDFGVASAWSPAEKTVTVCNIGACDLSVVAVSVGCADFSLVSNPFPASLPPASCLDVVVGFTPVLPGPKSCQLTIASDDPDSPLVSRTLTGRTPPAFSLHAGLVKPHGALSGLVDDGSTLNFDFVYWVGPQLAWDVRLGLSRFDGSPGLTDVEVATLSSNARFTINPAAPVRFFVNAGPGLYHFDPGSLEGGVNGGLGLNVPAGSRFSFEATYNYHFVFTATPDQEYSQVQLGLLVSF